MIYKTWTISQPIIDQTTSFLQSGQHEVFVIWTAKLHDDSQDCEVKRVIMPKQKAGFTRFGAYVHIDGTELSRIQFDNYDKKERSVIQLHTHPSGDVRMSELDREWEVVKHVGALSIIIPSYCNRGINGFKGANVYEREVTGWRLWSEKEVITRLKVR